MEYEIIYESHVSCGHIAEAFTFLSKRRDKYAVDELNFVFELCIFKLIIGNAPFTLCEMIESTLSIATSLESFEDNAGPISLPLVEFGNVISSKHKSICTLDRVVKRAENLIEFETMRCQYASGCQRCLSYKFRGISQHYEAKHQNRNKTICVVDVQWNRHNLRHNAGLMGCYQFISVQLAKLLRKHANEIFFTRQQSKHCYETHT